MRESLNKDSEIRFPADKAEQVPRRDMATSNSNRSPKPHSSLRLPVNVDFLAIGIALTLAVLIRFGVIHQITF
jgi:hypothetical protein